MQKNDVKKKFFFNEIQENDLWKMSEDEADELGSIVIILKILTDTGEDSKLVHRRNWSKVCTAPPR